MRNKMQNGAADADQIATLLNRARGGDRQALAELYESTYPELWRTARSMVSSEDDAMDVLQDSYLKAFSRLDTLDKPESFLPWLNQIVRNTARDHLRRKRPALFTELKEERSLTPDFEDPDFRARPEAVLDRKETQRLIRAMLNALTEEQRIVVGMYYYQQLPVKEIANYLKVSPNTVKGQLRAGRKKIEARVRLLEKQGVSLCGMPPIVFFQEALQQSLDAPAPTMPERFTAQIERQEVAGPKAKPARNITVRKAASGRLILRRIGLGAAAAAAVGALALGVVHLNRQPLPDYGSVQPEVSASESSTWETPHPEMTESEPESGGPTGELRQYEPWQEDYLSLLAGVIRPGDGSRESNLNYGGALESFSTHSTNFRGYYLGDVTGDGIPEILYLADHFDSKLLTVSSWRDGGILESSGDALIGENRAGVVLNLGEAGFCAYASGRTDLSVNSDYTAADRHAALTDPLFHELIHEPFLELPEQGSLSRAQIGDSFPAEYECWNLEFQTGIMDPLKLANPSRMERFRLTDTGEEYFLIDRAYVTEGEYRTREQELLSSAVCQFLGSADADWIRQIPAAKLLGPLNCQELADALGGFDERPEWSGTKALLESRQTRGQRIRQVAADLEGLKQTLAAQYPQQAVGEGEWDFAVLDADWPAMEIRYRQSPAEGGDWFLANWSTFGSVFGGLLFQRVSDTADISLYYHPQIVNDSAEIVIRRPVGTSLGIRHILTLPGGVYDAGEQRIREGPEAMCISRHNLRGLSFVSAEELLDRYAADEEDGTVDLSEPVPWDRLLDHSDGEPLSQLLIPWVEHPDLLLQANSAQLSDAALDLAWENAVWDGAVADVADADRRSLHVLLRGRLPAEQGERWIVAMLFCNPDDGYTQASFYGPVDADETTLLFRRADEGLYWREDLRTARPLADDPTRFTDADGRSFSLQDDPALRRVDFVPLSEVVSSLTGG